MRLRCLQSKAVKEQECNALLSCRWQLLLHPRLSRCPVHRATPTALRSNPRTTDRCHPTKSPPRTKKVFQVIQFQRSGICASRRRPQSRVSCAQASHGRSSRVAARAFPSHPHSALSRRPYLLPLPFFTLGCACSRCLQQLSWLAAALGASHLSATASQQAHSASFLPSRPFSPMFLSPAPPNQRRQRLHMQIRSPPPSPAALSFSMRIVTIDHYMAHPLPQLVPPTPCLNFALPTSSCQPSPKPSGLRICTTSRQSNPPSSRHATLRCYSEWPKDVQHARAPRVPVLARASDSCGCRGRSGCLRQQVSIVDLVYPLCRSIASELHGYNVPFCF
jgi:hypothetical protein